MDAPNIEKKLHGNGQEIITRNECGNFLTWIKETIDDKPSHGQLRVGTTEDGGWDFGRWYYVIPRCDSRLAETVGRRLSDRDGQTHGGQTETVRPGRSDS